MPKKEPFVQTGGRVLTLEDWMRSNPSLVAGFSTKQGGVSHAPYDGLNVGFHVNDVPDRVLLNRKLIADELGFPLSTWAVGEQVHRGEIAKVTHADKGSGALSHEAAIPFIDGLYTKERNILLVSLYADCVPLFFYVPSKQIIGLAHAGWKGTAENIAANMIRTLINDEAVELGDIQVVIGPSISQRAYEVNHLVIEKMTAVLPNQINKIAIKNGKDKYLLDLKEANKQLLLATGIKEEQISVTNYCTAIDKALFYSHRRDNQITGRMMSFIGLKS